MLTCNAEADGMNESTAWSVKEYLELTNHHELKTRQCKASDQATLLWNVVAKHKRLSISKLSSFVL